MKEIIRVERKRVLNAKILFLILAFVFIYSIYICYLDYTKYNVYDSSGNISISAMDNLSESKKNGEFILNTEKLQEIIKRRDKGGYISYLNPARIILANYTDKRIIDITNDDISGFYNRRLLNMESDFRQDRFFSDQQIDFLLVKAKQLNTPIKAGYADGWRNINNDMTDFMPIMLVIVSVIMLSVFGKNSKADMDQLCLSTTYGKRTLIIVKILAGLEIGTGIYFISVILFTLPKLIAFGVNGYNLPIQSDPMYFYSTYNMTYIEQYLLNMAIGLIALFFTVSIVLFLTSVTEQILSGAVLVVFFWVLMLASPSSLAPDFRLTHYVISFLPYNMTNFSNYYIRNELYDVFGRLIPSASWTIFVGIVISAILTLSTLAVNIIKIKGKSCFGRA